MKKILEQQKIYYNNELQEFVYSLECKYKFRDLTNRYHNLVNFSENAETPFLNWFRYREGFSGKLIRELIIDSGAQKDEIILDPFSGSGTTPVVAVLNGYNGLGIDVNPLSTFIANVKMSKFSYDELCICRNMAKDILNLPSKCADKADKYNDIRKYFTDKNYTDLCSLRDYIDTISNPRIRDIFLTAFLCIIESSSNRRRDGNGLKTVKTKINDVKEYFYMKLLDIVKDLEQSSKGSLGQGLCITGSAINLHDIFMREYSETNKKVGTIIFSPPYPNSFDYFESYKLELVFGGFSKDISGIKTFRDQAVRSFVGVKSQETCDHYIDLFADEIEKAIPLKESETGKKDSRTRKVPNMIKGYFADMKEAIRQCGLCLEKGKKVYIVIDQSAYVGVIIPTDLLLAYISESVGFNVASITECRKARTSTQQLKKYPYLKNVLRESIVELIKK